MLRRTYLQHIKYNMSIIDRFLATLAPHTCIGCNAEGSLLCAACVSTLPAVENYNDKSPALTKVRAVTPYSGAAKALVWQLKSAGAQAAATIMVAQMLNHLEPARNMLIVPVPTASSRVRQRGYDQAKLLARTLARQAGLPYQDCLARIGQTHQVGATREKRLRQLQEAFRVRRPKAIQAAHLVLVDDVTTTGATLELAAGILIAAGARRVDAIVFAQA